MPDVLYHSQLLDHYRNPRHRGELQPSMSTKDGINANCGDQIRLGLDLHDQTIRGIRYQIRACAVCTASASIMGELIDQRSFSEVRALIQNVRKALKHKTDWPDRTEALTGMTDHINRHACVLLPWDACEAILNAHRDDE